MAKPSKKSAISRPKKSNLNATKKGKIEKNKRLELERKVKKVTIENSTGKKKIIDKRNGNHQNKADDNNSIKKKPSKAELKTVIDKLKGNPELILVRKALKYVPFYLKSEGLTKKLLKEVIRLWAESGEKVRVVCLLCLIRIYTKLKDKERKQDVIKKLYNSFLDKCRITKRETMSMIGFMRHSLIELYKLDPAIAHKQAQTACQQLTLTLKNANTHKNEETYKTVLNWQFCNCLILLSNLIISQEKDSPVKTLTHQVIQLNLGSINLMTSPRYYPFYCHVIENLIGLSISTNLFIPILPLIMNIIDKMNIPLENKKKRSSKNENNKNQRNKNNKKNENNSDDDDDENEEQTSDEDQEDNELDDDEKVKKEYNMDLLNHVSLDEAHSKDYIEAVSDKVYELLLSYLASQCHRIAFPELVLLPCVQLKRWLKKNPGRAGLKFKVLLEKIKSDSNKIDEERKSVDFAFTDYNAVDAWEKKFKDSNRSALVTLSERKVC